MKSWATVAIMYEKYLYNKIELIPREVIFFKIAHDLIKVTIQYSIPLLYT